jgi:hypothetical protein
MTKGHCTESESRPVLSANAVTSTTTGTTTGMIFQADANDIVSYATVDSPETWRVKGTLKASASMPYPSPYDPLKVPQCGPLASGVSQTDCFSYVAGDIGATTSGFSQEEYAVPRTGWQYFEPSPGPTVSYPLTCKVHDDCPNANPTYCTNGGNECGCGAYLYDDPKTGKPPDKTRCYMGLTAPGAVAMSASDVESGSYPQAQWSWKPALADDGLNAAFDPGGSSMWIAASCGQQAGTASNGSCLGLFPVCKKGAVGSSACPLSKVGTAKGLVDLYSCSSASAGCSGSPDSSRYRLGHATVTVNPCTHHALVSFVDADGTHSYLVVEAVNHEGQIIAHWQIQGDLASSGQTFDTQCNDAGGSFDCAAWPLCPDPSSTVTDCSPNNEAQVSRTVSRPELDVKVDTRGSSPACSLYVGWDRFVGTPFRHEATLAELNVTPLANGNEDSSQALGVLTWADPTQGESFDATPIASRFGDGYSFFYVQRDPKGVTQTLRARVTTDSSFVSYTDLPVSDAMPDTTWFGDFVAQLNGGLPGGNLLATWPELTTLNGAGCRTIDGAIITVGPLPVSSSGGSGLRKYIPVVIPALATWPTPPPDPTMQWMTDEGVHPLNPVTLHPEILQPGTLQPKTIQVSTPTPP